MTVKTIMDIKTFLNLCTGNWFSQRTNYQLGSDKTDSSKADLKVTMLSAEDTQITPLCQEYRIDPQKSLGGLLYSWDTSVDWGKPKVQGSSLMIFVPDDGEDRGTLITNAVSQTGAKSKGSYLLGVDEALTLTIDIDGVCAEERLWFASENLRLRTTTIKNATDITQTTFYSEIRKAPPKKEQ